MKEFLVTYYREFIALFCFLIELIFSLVIVLKKNKKEPSIFSSILGVLPHLIKDAERLIGCGNGSKKLEFVLSQASRIYKRQTGQEMSSSEKAAFTSFIEDILETPQRKER